MIDSIVEMWMVICLTIMAVEPAKRQWQEYSNWKQRKEIHQKHLEELERNEDEH
jgi:hypothetical protein